MSRILANRYEVGELIGAGGMADVYQGRDTRLSRPVAIKILRSDLARDPAFLARFRREAQAAAGLNHPAIVSVYDTGEEATDGAVLPFIVMEQVNGKTIREIIRSGERLPISRAVAVIRGILEALEYSHRNGIIHRDIKPANVMLTTAGDVKVMDFGIARALDDASATVTHAWTVVGTANYLSPEQARGEVADSRSDIYSVGCLLYELLTGRPPFLGDTPVAIAYQHVSADYLPVSELIEDLPAGVDNIISGALSKDPLARYQSAREMLDDINRLDRGEEVKKKIRNPRRRNLLIAATLAVLVFVAAGAYLISRIPAPISLVAITDVSGLTESQAREALAGFVITIERAPDPRIPADRVASQTPTPGSKVEPGSQVQIIISDGPGKTSVPTNLIGKTLEEAKPILDGAGLVLAKTNAVESSEAPGTIVAVVPTPGTNVQAGSGVVLNIASGNIFVPDVLGATKVEATTILIQAGFVPNVIEVQDAEQPIGVVLAQAPAADESAKIGSSVTITINTFKQVAPSASPTPVATLSPGTNQ
jgi:serine/threonine-protein kinase